MHCVNQQPITISTEMLLPNNSPVFSFNFLHDKSVKFPVRERVSVIENLFVSCEVFKLLLIQNKMGWTVLKVCYQLLNSPGV